jgi:hypothetical protein
MTQEQGQQPEEVSEEVMGFLADPKTRQALLKHLAQNNPNEYLSMVRINGQAIPSQAINSRFIASDKEWQE